LNLSYDEAEQVLKLPNSYFERGYKKGLEEGVEKGRKELLQTIVVRMLKNGLDPQLIVEMTGLSQTEVEKIKQRLEYS
jgi:predicted transposase/invertase (TIGR01784 family)